MLLIVWWISAEEVDVFKCKQVDMARSWVHVYLLLVFWSGAAEAFPARRFHYMYFG